MAYSYKPSTDYPWIDNSYIKVEQKNPKLIQITINREGLYSLANQLELFANDNADSFCYEEWPGDLEEGSCTLEIVKTKLSGRKNIELNPDHDIYN